MKPLQSDSLTVLLEAEIAQGNSIVQDVRAPQWPPVFRFLRLAKPFKTSPKTEHPDLRYLKIDDFHYWFEEATDTSTDEVIACGFGTEADNFAPAVETKHDT